MLDWSGINGGLPFKQNWGSAHQGTAGFDVTKASTKGRFMIVSATAVYDDANMEIHFMENPRAPDAPFSTPAAPKSWKFEPVGAIKLQTLCLVSMMASILIGYF